MSGYPIAHYVGTKSGGLVIEITHRRRELKFITPPDNSVVYFEAKEFGEWEEANEVLFSKAGTCLSPTSILHLSQWAMSEDRFPIEGLET